MQSSLKKRRMPRLWHRLPNCWKRWKRSARHYHRMPRSLRTSNLRNKPHRVQSRKPRENHATDPIRIHGRSLGIHRANNRIHRASLLHLRGIREAFLAMASWKRDCVYLRDPVLHAYWLDSLVTRHWRNHSLAMTISSVKKSVSRRVFAPAAAYGVQSELIVTIHPGGTLEIREHGRKSKSSVFVDISGIYVGAVRRKVASEKRSKKRGCV